MTKDELTQKAKKYLEDNFTSKNNCCEQLILDWVDAVMSFRSESVNSCCHDALRSVQHFILQESHSADYIVRRGAMFGDLHEIRDKGFENRFLHNTKLFKTYIEAYQKTEEEYEMNFGKKRYSSYGSFRQVRRRKHRT